MSYPKWLYHAEKEAVIVPDEAAHKALGAGWVESPALCEKPEELTAAAPAEAHVPAKRGRKPKHEVA
jgi:hypothetical protein